MSKGILQKNTVYFYCINKLLHIIAKNPIYLVLIATILRSRILMVPHTFLRDANWNHELHVHTFYMIKDIVKCHWIPFRIGFPHDIFQCLVILVTSTDSELIR